jgi:serine/threonine-protein kinase
MAAVNWSSRYETIAEIGSGGMASVWVGRVRGGGDQLVALKRAHSHVKADNKAYEAMIREANLAARVRHPNVVGVLDVDQVDGDLVIVLDYVEGCTLRLLLNRLEEQRVLRPREIVRILLDIAAGLHAAHRVGLIHRDISPSNILIGSDGVARLADFGIAKAQFEGSEGERTATGILKGKLAYMAPEYLMYQRVDASSDLFSFAVCAWESLTGRRLFKGDSDLETLAKIADADIRPISKEVPELAAFDPPLRRALSKMPEDRHASVEEFAYELETIARNYDLLASHHEVSALIELIAEPELRERRMLVQVEQQTIARVSAPPVVPVAEISGDLPTQVHTSRRPRVSTPPLPPPPATARRNTRAEVEARREKLALVGALMLLALALGWMWTQLSNQDRPTPIPKAARNTTWQDAAPSPAAPTADAAVRPVTTPSPVPFGGVPFGGAIDRGNTPRRGGR